MSGGTPGGSSGGDRDDAGGSARTQDGPGAGSHDPFIGRLLSERYRIDRKLGEGGMASVYLAEHVELQKRVALKILAPELARREELAARFVQEARAASRIDQENVIAISDFGRADGLAFFVMEYLEGADLGELLREQGVISFARARNIVLQIGKALRAAHALGIIHRDLKPENIFLIGKEGRPDFVKLLDFGIAKVSGGALGGDGPRLTRAGMIFGTPEYMAPEQAEGKPADHRADLYSVGCILYHCVTGTPPFSAESLMALLTKHLLEAPEPPSTRRPDLAIAPEVDALVMRALEKDRERRFDSADDMMAALAAIPADARAGSDLYGSRDGSRATAAGRPTIRSGSGGHGPYDDAMAPPTTGDDARLDPASSAELLGLVSPPSRWRRWSALAILGLALGVVAAGAFALLRDRPEPTTPTATINGGSSLPTGAAPNTTPPEPPSGPEGAATRPVEPIPPAAAPTSSGRATQEPQRSDKEIRPRRPRTRPAPPPTDPESPMPPSTLTPRRPPIPTELKPFPE